MSRTVFGFVSAYTLTEVLLIDFILLFSNNEELKRQVRKYFVSAAFVYIVYYIICLIHG